MAKTSGLGDNFYLDGNDLSGDTNSLSNISGSMKPIDVTGINVSAHERIGGLRDGSISWVSYWNSANAHLVLSPLPVTDRITTYMRGTAVGNAAACMVGKQLNYDPTRGTDGSLTAKVQVDANGFGLEWGEQLTPGIRTDTAATSGATQDDGAGFVTPGVLASGTPVTNTSSLPAQVVISAGTLTAVVVNGVTVGAGDGTYTVPPGGTISITYTVAPTWTWALQSGFGFQAYLQVFGFVGTDVTVKIQDSADGVTWADLASGAFTQVTSANQAQRIAVGGTATVRRYLRATSITTGGFTSAAFAVVFMRNVVAVTF